MGSQQEFTKLLGLDGFSVKALEFEDEGLRARIRIRIERRAPRRYPCGGCGRRCSRVRDAKDRTWNDLPWAEHPVTLVYSLRRVRCRWCGIRAEQVPFADPMARVTRRLRQQIGLDCQSMPTSHAAVRWRVSWGKARRAEKAFLGAWEAGRPKRRPRHLGADEIQRGKGQKYWTVLSDLVHGEVIGLARDRTEDALKSLLLGQLDARQRSAVEAVCTDMHHPYVKAVTEVLPHAAVVFDKFHVLQHAANALDEVRRQEFFRAGPVMRQYGRGKRWLLLHRVLAATVLDRRKRGAVEPMAPRFNAAMVGVSRADRYRGSGTPTLPCSSKASSRRGSRPAFQGGVGARPSNRTAGRR